MKNSFERSAIASAAILLSLVVLIKLPASIENNRVGRLIDRVLSKIRTADFKAEDLETLDAGYYEGLRKEGSVDPSLRFRNDFLEYDYKPNLHLNLKGLGRTTNSFGMYDREYTVEKPPNTWRIALLGDSMALGPFGRNYESLLENRLNETQLNSDIRKFEVLNFAVGGYRITQIMEAMTEKAARFHPDVYMVAITGVGVSHRWSFHIGHLLQRKIDLKYDFLRQVVADAHVQPSDSLETIDRKLTPFTPTVFSWCLEQMKDKASEQSARMVILLIPEPLPSNLIAPQFSSARPLIEKAGVPVIDLLDTYAASKNLMELRVSQDDVHANGRGHKMVFENLYRKISQDPKLSDFVFGTNQSKAARMGASQSLLSPAAPSRLRRHEVTANHLFGSISRINNRINNLNDQGASRMSDPSTDQIKEEIRQYVLNEFLPGEKASNLHDDTPLRSSGIIDSVGLLRMIDFIENRYTIQVEAHEAGVENFDRIEDIATFIQNKRRAGA